MTPTCSNCGATEFVWANEVKTGAPGSGLSLRARGEAPMGTRICQGCGHADLFLRDLDLIHKPHLWRPGEFVPIRPKASPTPGEVHRSVPNDPVPAPATPVPVAPVAAAPVVEAPPPPPPDPAPAPTVVTPELPPEPAPRSKPSRRRIGKARAESSA